MRASLLLVPLLFAACTDNSQPKLLEVTNQTDRAIHVEFGATDFGLVAPGATTDYLEFDNGKLDLRFDGQIVDSEKLADDLFGGQWTLLIQPVGSTGQIFGFVSDEL